MKDLLEIIDDIQSDFDIYIDNEEVKKAYRKAINIKLEVKYIEGYDYHKEKAKVTKREDLYLIEIYVFL